MKKSMKFATALAGAAVVVVGGTAFTAGNTLPNVTAGTATNTVSGASVTSQVYTLDGSGNVSQIVFTVAAFGGGATKTYAATALVNDKLANEGTPPCNVDETAKTITCAWSGDNLVALSAVDSTTLTVTPAGDISNPT